MKKILIFLITLYQKIPFRSHSSCPFLPTCSDYAKEAIEKHGSLKGSFKAGFRICRCHPWQKGGYDPV